MSLTIKKYIEGVIGPYISSISAVLKRKANLTDIPKTPSIDSVTSVTITGNVINLDFSATSKIQISTSQAQLVLQTAIIPPLWTAFNGILYITSTSPGGTIVNLGPNVHYVGGDGLIIIPNHIMRFMVDVRIISGSTHVYVTTTNF